MSIIKTYKQEDMRYINAFEQITKVRAKDLFSSGETLLFLTERDAVKIAVGREGINVRNLTHTFQKRVKIIGWAESAEELVKSYLFPMTAESVALNADKNIEVLFKFAKQRRYLLDNQQANLKELCSLIKHFHPEVVGIKVL